MGVLHIVRKCLFLFLYGDVRFVLFDDDNPRGWTRQEIRADFIATEYAIHSAGRGRTSASCAYYLVRSQVRMPVVWRFFVSSPKRPAWIGTAQTPDQWGGGFFAGDKVSGVWSWPLAFTAEAENKWSYTFVPTVCIYGVDRYSFTFYSKKAVWYGHRTHCRCMQGVGGGGCYWITLDCVPELSALVTVKGRA